MPEKPKKSRFLNEAQEEEGFKQALESLFYDKEKRKKEIAKQDYASVRHGLHKAPGSALFTQAMTVFYLGITSSALRELRRRRKNGDPFAGQHSAKKEIILKWYVKSLREKSGLTSEVEGNIGLDYNANLFVAIKDKATGKTAVLCNRLITSIDDQLLQDTLANQKARVLALTPEQAIEKPWIEQREKVAFINAYRAYLQQQHAQKMQWLDREESSSNALSVRDEIEAATPRAMKEPTINRP
jgi:hypothetical protein